MIFPSIRIEGTWKGQGIHNMEAYRKTIKKRITLFTVSVIIALGFGIYNVFFATTAMKNSEIFGFQCGLATSLGFFSLIFIVRCRRILKDEHTLKLHYIKEHDERTRAIRAKAGIPMLMFTSVAMIIAGVVSGYFNITVFHVLILAALCQMIVCCAAKLFYLRTM